MPLLSCVYFVAPSCSDALQIGCLFIKVFDILQVSVGVIWNVVISDLINTCAQVT